MREIAKSFVQDFQVFLFAIDKYLTSETKSEKLVLSCATTLLVETRLSAARKLKRDKVVKRSRGKRPPADRPATSRRSINTSHLKRPCPSDGCLTFQKGRRRGLAGHSPTRTCDAKSVQSFRFPSRQTLVSSKSPFSPPAGDSRPSVSLSGKLSTVL